MPGPVRGAKGKAMNEAARDPTPWNLALSRETVTAITELILGHRGAGGHQGGRGRWESVKGSGLLGNQRRRSLEEELTSEVPDVGQEKGTPGRRTSRCQGPEVRGVWSNLGTEIGGGTVEHGRKQAGRQIRSHKGYGKPAGSDALCIQGFGVRVIWSVGKITNSVTGRKVRCQAVKVAA